MGIKPAIADFYIRFLDNTFADVVRKKTKEKEEKEVKKESGKTRFKNPRLDRGLFIY